MKERLWLSDEEREKYEVKERNERGDQYTCAAHVNATIDICRGGNIWTIQPSERDWWCSIHHHTQASSTTANWPLGWTRWPASILSHTFPANADTFIDWFIYIYEPTTTTTSRIYSDENLNDLYIQIWYHKWNEMHVWYVGLCSQRRTE